MKTICYVTGTRADYGLMKKTLQAIDHDPKFKLSLCVTAMHLSHRYGHTVDEIIADGFPIAAKIPVDLDKTTGASMVTAIGHEIIAMTEVFERERPDIVLLLGDRGETLAAALSAIHLNLFVVHIHGGERSGTVDEMVRHAISKLSHYHFVATQASKQRLIRLGEYPSSIFVTGAPGLDGMTKTRRNKTELYQSLGFDVDRPTALCVYHPVVQEQKLLQQQFQNLILAAKQVKLQLLCLTPNADAGGNIIRDALYQYESDPDIRIVIHLPRQDYLDHLAAVDFMIGNSSSAIIEAASFQLPVVNVGSRQNRREQSNNVINVNCETEAIVTAINTALTFDTSAINNCYGDGDGQTAQKVVTLLNDLSLNPDVLKKTNAY